MDRTAADTITKAFLANIHRKLQEAASIAKAADERGGTTPFGAGFGGLELAKRRFELPRVDLRRDAKQ